MSNVIGEAITACCEPQMLGDEQTQRNEFLSHLVAASRYFKPTLMLLT